MYTGSTVYNGFSAFGMTTGSTACTVYRVTTGSTVN